MHARDRKSDGQQPGPSRQTEQSTDSFIVRSTFVEETLDNRNDQVWLMYEDIANVGRIKYAWHKENGNVMFEVIGSVEQLEKQLKHYKSILKEKQSLTFIINLNNDHWTTLIIVYNQAQLCAYYIDSLGKELPYSINKTLKDIIEDIYIEDFKIKQQDDGHNCGIFALENARVINEALQNSHMPKAEDLLNLQLTEDGLKAIRKEFALNLYKRDRIESKFKVLLKFLKKLNTQQSKMEGFNYQNANILLFLETLALQDPILQVSSYQDSSKLWDYEQKLVDQGIIDYEDLDLVKHIRSNKIFHREVDSEIKPSDFLKIVNLNQDDGIRGFFQNLEKYVQQVCIKLKGEMLDKSNFKQLKELLKVKDKQIGKTITTDQLRDKISKFFKNANAGECYEDRLNLKKVNEMMFDFVVNIIPFINKTYKKPAEPIEKIKWFRGDLIHKFYEFGDNHKLMGIAFKIFMRDYRHYFFNYYYSQEVCKVLKSTTIYDNAETINKKLKSLLKNFQNKYGKEYLAAEEDIDKENSFEFVASELVYSKVNCKDNLKNCVHEYFKLMSIIDNEEAIKKREKKYKEGNIPARYKELSGSDRREIYEDFKRLNDLFKKSIIDSKEYEKEKELLVKKFKKVGILKDDFNAMVKSYVENDDYSSFDGESTVTNALFVLGEIKKCHPDLSNQDIIDKFHKRKNVKGNRGTFEEKINSIPKGIVINISILSGKDGKLGTVSINTDKFIQNIFEMFNNAYIKYHLVFNNIEEAFNDEIFLDYLANENVNVSKDLVKKLLEIGYPAPYVARLVTKDELINKGIITDKEFLETIEKLLGKNAYIKHLKQLLKKVISDQKTRQSNIIENEINGKKLKNILKPNDKSYNASNIKSVFYEQICNIIISNDVNIENMDLIFEEPEYTEGILTALSKKEKTELIKKILKLLNDIVTNKLYTRNNKDLDLALILLDGKNGANKARKSLIDKKLAERNDLDILQAKLTIARIRNRQGKLKKNTDEARSLYEKAYGILVSMKDNIQASLSNDALFHFLLILSNLAYTQHLLHQYSEAYKTYETLYTEIKFIIQSETYKRILKLSPKYLDILKIRSDMAYQLRCLANANQNSLPKKESQDYKIKLNEVSGDYQNALNIYKEVYEIKSTNAAFDQDIVKTMRDIAYINDKLSCLKLSEDHDEEKLKSALSHYDIALKTYEKVKKIQVQEKWNTYPAVLSTEQDIVQAKRSIAYVNNKLGKLKNSQDNPVEALKHHNEALRIYKKVLNIQKRTQNEEPKYILNTMSDIAYTNNNLARLKSQDNPVEALKHYIEAYKIYEEVLEIQMRTLYEECNKIEKTKKNLKDTKAWMNKLLFSTLVSLCILL